jgi:arylformamidase
VEIIDVSVPVWPGMVMWPGDSEVRLERVSSIADGAVANVSRFDFGVHSGTHVDAPLHFFDGAAGAEALPLDVLVGPCVVVDGLEPAAVPAGSERVLFKTSNSRLWERESLAEDAVELDGEAALPAPSRLVLHRPGRDAATGRTGHVTPCRVRGAATQEEA